MERGTAEQPRVDELSVSEDGTTIEKWHGVVNAIRATTKDAFPASPPFDASSPSAFQTYWRTVFSRLRQDVSTNPEIPRHLTTPPVTKFTVTLFDEIHGLCCPCGHPDVDPNITLENRDGVTKDEFMDGFINCMYGETLPTVYIEPNPPQPDNYDYDAAAEEDMENTEGDCEEEGPALVYSAAWMSCGTNENGEKQTYSSEPNIVLYCCRPEEYAGKREDGDGRESVNTKEAEQGRKAKL